MRRVSPVWVVISIPIVIGGTWWLGTRHYDFLEKPTATEIETAKVWATAEMARPSDLFAIETTEPVDEVTPPPTPKPTKPKPKAPQIDVSDPSSAAPLDAWTERGDLPAGSFIELASRLESDAHLGWARVTWERVIDLADSSPEDLEVAVRAIGRIRATMVPPETAAEDAPEVRLLIAAPEDRVELTRRAAEEAAEILEQAADREASIVATVTIDDSEEPGLRVSLVRPAASEEDAGSTLSEAPSDPDIIRHVILKSSLKLITSALATSGDLKPISPMGDDETAAEALATRITRRAWAAFLAESP